MYNTLTAKREPERTEGKQGESRGKQREPEAREDVVKVMPQTIPARPRNLVAAEIGKRHDALAASQLVS